MSCSAWFQCYLRWIRWTDPFLRCTKTSVDEINIDVYYSLMNHSSHLLLPRPRSMRPSLCLWKSKTRTHRPCSNQIRAARSLPRCARSEINKRFDQLFTPRDSFFWISSTSSGKLTTQPLPRNTSGISTNDRFFSTLTDDVSAILQMKTGRQHMEVVLDTFDDDTMTSIVSTLGKSLDVVQKRVFYNLLDIDKQYPLRMLVDPPICLCPVDERDESANDRNEVNPLTSSPHWAPRTIETIDGLG